QKPSKIEKCNQRLSPTLKSNEPTIQVVLDALKLTPFYKAFEVSANVPEIYMQEFRATVSKHYFSLRFKMNGKCHTVNVDNFRDILKICPKLPGRKFEEPPFEEEILSLIRDLRHTDELKVLSDVNVNHMHQPWRSFAAIINKCLTGKTTALESLRLSLYQVENKNSKKNNDMYYPCFTKVIVHYFMAKDPSISRRNKMFWHNVEDDSMFTMIRVISKHHDTQIYGAIFPKHLTNQAMLAFEAYKTYHTYATGEKTPKPKYVKKKADSETSPKKKYVQDTKGKRLKTLAKGDKTAKKKQPATKSKAKGLTVLSELFASGSGADEGTDDDNDDDDERTKSDNDGDDFVHPKLTTYDSGEKHNEEEEDKEDSFNPLIHTPSYVDTTDDEDYDDITQGDNDEEEKLDEEKTNEEEEVNELYKDVDINLEGRDTEMADAP
ncbi:hypothetical protein Tco_0760058, partial [Tanacetum coccineum]